MKKLMALLLSVVMIFCFTFTVAYAEPIVDDEIEDEKEDENVPRITVKVDGNAIEKIDNNTIDTICNMLETNLDEDETSVITIVVSEGSINECADNATEEALDMLFDGTTIPIEKTFLNISVTQEISSGDGYTRSHKIDDLETTLDIVYNLPTDTSLKAIVCTNEISRSKLDQLSITPDTLEDEDYSYFIDGSVVHIYTQSLTMTYGFAFADGVFEVTFDTNGGFEALDSIFTDQLYGLPEITKSVDWEFVNWLYDDGTPAKLGDIISNDVTLTAEWKRLGEFIPTENGVYITENDDDKLTVTLVDGLAYGKKANINTVVGKDKKTYKITRIADEAFENDHEITEVIIGPNVKWIGNYAFFNCDKLSSLSIGAGVEDIGFGAFANCDNLSSLKINVEDIPDGLFSYCDITKLTLGPNVKTIGDGAFSNTKITKLKTNNVISIGDEAFCNCEDLVSLNINDSLETVGRVAFAGCINLKKLSIGSGVEELDVSAFDDCEKLRSVNINMSYIPDGLFIGHDITKLVIGPNVRTIGESAFEDCETLKKVSFNRVRVINNRAFANTGITKVNTRKVKAIGDEVFGDCPNLTSVTISNSAKTVGRGVFCNCDKLNRISIGSGVEELDVGAFDDLCNLAKLSVNMAEIPDWVFADQNITTLTIGPNVRTIGESAFMGCERLKTININSKHLTELDVLGDDFLQNIKPKATIKIPSKVFKKTKAVFMEKSGAGDFIKYRKK